MCYSVEKLFMYYLVRTSAPSERPMLKTVTFTCNSFPLQFTLKELRRRAGGQLSLFLTLVFTLLHICLHTRGLRTLQGHLTSQCC